MVMMMMMKDWSNGSSAVLMGAFVEFIGFRRGRAPSRMNDVWVFLCVLVCWIYTFQSRTGGFSSHSFFEILWCGAGVGVLYDSFWHLSHSFS